MAPHYNLVMSRNYKLESNTINELIRTLEKIRAEKKNGDLSIYVVSDGKQEMPVKGLNVTALGENSPYVILHPFET